MDSGQSTEETPAEPASVEAPKPEPAALVEEAKPEPAPVETAPVEEPKPEPAPAPPVEEPKPEPVAEPAPEPQPAPAAPAPAQPVAEKKPEQQLTPEQKKELKAKKKKAKKKKLIISLSVTAGVVFVVMIVMVFLLLTQGGGSNNPLLQMFGISEDNFYPFLISLTNVIFGFGVFIAFIVGVIGIFLTSMAKKHDKQKKKKGIVMASIGGFACLVLVFAWGFTYMYLSSQFTEAQEAQDTSVIKTVPENLTGLTAPLTVEFDVSGLYVNPYQYEIISYEWDFGDESSATGPTVSHRYTEKGPDAGRYIVTLDIKYEDVNTGEELLDTFNLDVVFSNEQVAAAFTADPMEGELPLDVKFDASESVDPDGEITAYEWDLDADGDYDDAEGVETTHTYTKAGSYEVGLRITDNNGEYAYTSVTVEAGTNVPVAVITEPAWEYYMGVEYSFSAADSTSPNGTIDSYEWDFGDGSGTAKTMSAKHTYDAVGTYTLNLKVTDEDGFIGSDSVKIIVDVPSVEPVADISTSPGLDEEENAIVGQVPLSVGFNASGSTDGDDNIIEYEWDFDADGVIDDTGISTIYVFQEEGTYATRLIVTDADGNEDIATVMVTVESQGLEAAFSATPVSGEIPLEVDFDASGSSYPDGEIVAYKWDFGDGTSEYVGGAEIEYEYDSIGTFDVVLTVVASDGAEDSTTIQITVRPVTLTSCFEPNVYQGPAPLVVTFNPSCSAGSVQDYFWDFGDGDKSYDNKPTHTYVSFKKKH